MTGTQRCLARYQFLGTLLSAAMGASGCTVDLSIPDNTAVHCSANTDCLKDYVCNPLTHTCQRALANLAPQISLTIDTPLDVRWASLVTIEALVADPNGAPVGDDRIDVLFEYSTNGSTWCPASIVDGQTTGIAASALGTEIAVVWDAAGDALSPGNCTAPMQARQVDGIGDGEPDATIVDWSPALRVRARATDQHGLSTLSSPTSTFPLGNAPPSIEFSVPDLLHADTAISFWLFDSSLDPANVEAQFRPDATQAWSFATLTGVGERLSTSLPEQPAADPYIVIWNTQSDLGQNNFENVELRLRALDTATGTPNYGPWSPTMIRPLRNQTPPRIEDLQVLNQGPGARTGLLTLGYRLVDNESDLCDVRVEFSVDGGSTWRPCTEYPSLASSGLYDLPSAPVGQLTSGRYHRFVWDIGSDVAARSSDVLVRVAAADDGGSGPAATVAVGAPVGANTAADPLAGYNEIIPRDIPHNNGIVEVGDFDCDGVLDVAIWERTTPFRVYWSFVVGEFTTGLLLGPWVTPDAPAEYALVTGDFNGDGCDDIATLADDGTLRIYKGKSEGDFDAAVLVPPAASNFKSGLHPRLVGADINGNGSSEIVVQTENNHLAVIGQSSTGDIAVQSATALGDLGSTLLRIVGGDLDGDGHADIVLLLDAQETVSEDASIERGRATLALFRGGASNGSPILGQGQTLDGLNNITWYYDNDNWVADVEGLAMAIDEAAGGSVGTLFVADNLFRYTSRVRALRYSGEGTLVRSIGEPKAGSAWRLRLADVNGDGTHDVVTIHGSSRPSKATVDLMTAALGSIGRLPAILGTVRDVNWLSLSMHAANRDPIAVFERTDCVFGTDKCVAVFAHSESSGVPSSGFLLGSSMPGLSGSASLGLAAGDMDGDGVADAIMISGHSSSRGAIALRGQAPAGIGNATLEVSSGFTPFVQAVGGAVGNLPFLTLGDYNGDGVLDAMLIDFSTNVGYHFLLGEASHGLSTLRFAPSIVQPSIGMIARHTGDFNHDGHDDLIVAESAATNQVVFGSNTDDGPVFIDGNFDFASGHNTVAVVSADFNADGYVDLAAIWVESGSHTMLRAAFGGPLGFTTSCTRQIDNRIPSAAAVGDVSDDGRVELILATNISGSSALHIAALTLSPGEPTCHIANKNQTFADLTMSLSSISMVDVNHDGLLDLVGMSGGNLYISTATASRWHHARQFSPPRLMELPHQVHAVAFADANSDGLADLFAMGEGQITLAPNERRSPFDSWSHRADALSVLGVASGDTLDRFGRPHRHSIGLRPTRGTPQLIQNAGATTRDFASAARQEGLLHPSLGAWQPLSLAWMFEDTERIQVIAEGPHAGREQVITRWGEPLDASAQPIRAAAVPLPLFLNCDPSCLENAQEIRVVAALRHWRRASEQTDDPLFGTTGAEGAVAASVLARRPNGRRLYIADESWEELPRAPNDEAGSVLGRHFVVDASKYPAMIHVITDQAGVYQAFVVP